MGSTLDKLKSDAGFAYEMILAIEGYDKLVTSGSTAAAIAAWAATDWTDAIGGLVYDGAQRQRLDPWKPEPEVGGATLRITGPDSETFGRLALKTASSDPTDESTLTAAVDNNDASVVVTSGAPFTSPGVAFLGCERFTYANKLGGILGTLVRGTYHPFNVDGATTNRFGRYHRIDTVNSGPALPPKVTQECTRWRGKWVGVWLHRKTASGVLDTKAEAQLIFAGRIVAIKDDTDGSTIIEADDVRGAIREKVLFEQQYSAKVKEGLRLVAGESFAARDHQSTGWNDAAPLVVVSGTPADDYEIQEGYHLVEDLLIAMNAWLFQALTDGDLVGLHTFGLITTDAGPRVQLSSRFDGALVTTNCAAEVSFEDHVAAFLGIVSSSNTIHIEGPGSTQLPQAGNEDAATADEPPYRVMAGQVSQFATGGREFEVVEEQGEFIDQEATLPAALDGYVTAGTVGVVDVNGQRMIAKYDGAGGFSEASVVSVLEGAEGFTTLRHRFALHIDEPGDIVVKQAIYLEDTLANLVLKLLASTGTSTYNHATYDAYDVQLGAAIPYELLGDPFEESLQSLEQSSAGGPSFVILDKATKLTEVLAADFMLRLANIIWKNETLQVTAWQTATTTLAVHALTESNKVSSTRNRGDKQRTPTDLTSDYMKNVVKLEFNREADGSYHDSLSISDIGSINENGGHEITIRARNTVGGAISLGEGIDQLAQGLLVKLPLLSRPLRMIRRTISQQFFEGVAPGDLAVVTDDFVRDPITGLRGIVGYPGIIFEHARNFRTGFGEVLIALALDDRTTAYCPCAEVDTTFTSGSYTNGYDSAGNKLQFQANRHSTSSDTPSTDIGSFTNGDEVTIVQIDPPTAASPRSWDRTLVAAGSNVATLAGAALAGYDGANEKYRMISRYYTTATSTQKVDTYQADDSDELVQNVAAPYQYGVFFLPPGQQITNADPIADLPSRHATLAYGDGAPLDVGYEDDLVRAANNFNHVKSALVGPQLFDDTCIVAAGAGWWFVDEIPLFVGKQKLVAMTRSLTIAPFARINTAGSKSLRVRLTRQGAFGDTNNGVDTYNPYTEVTFTLTSTTWGTATAQTISISPLAFGATGVCYLVVEAEETVEYKGMAQLQLGRGF